MVAKRQKFGLQLDVEQQLLGAKEFSVNKKYHNLGPSGAGGYAMKGYGIGASIGAAGGMVGTGVTGAVLCRAAGAHKVAPGVTGSVATVLWVMWVVFPYEPTSPTYLL